MVQLMPALIYVMASQLASMQLTLRKAKPIADEQPAVAPASQSKEK